MGFQWKKINRPWTECQKVEDSLQRVEEKLLLSFVQLIYTGNACKKINIV